MWFQTITRPTAQDLDCKVVSNLCLIYIQKHLCNSKQIKQQLSKFFNIIKHPNSMITIPFYKLPLESPAILVFLRKKNMGPQKKHQQKTALSLENWSTKHLERLLSIRSFLLGDSTPVVQSIHHLRR